MMQFEMCTSRSAGPTQVHRVLFGAIATEERMMNSRRDDFTDREQLEAVEAIAKALLAWEGCKPETSWRFSTGGGGFGPRAPRVTLVASMGIVSRDTSVGDLSWVGTLGKLLKISSQVDVYDWMDVH